MRAPLVALALGLLLGAALAAPALAQAPRSPSSRHGAEHYGKWLAAGTAVAFTVMAAHEHSRSRADWDDLLALCRSTSDACLRGSDGRYMRTDAEALYQRSLYYDRRANRRLLGAQGSLLVTAALFILDLRGRTDGPDNIPFSPFRVTAEPTRNGAAVGVQVRF